METERRRHVRYRVPNKFYAALGRDYTKVGKILNISLGGVAFEYISGPQQSPKASFVNLFMTDTPFHINGIPCKVVYDVAMRMTGDNHRDLSGLTSRFCGVRFHSATESQKKRVKAFIRVYLQGSAQ